MVNKYTVWEVNQKLISTLKFLLLSKLFLKHQTFYLIFTSWSNSELYHDSSYLTILSTVYLYKSITHSHWLTEWMSEWLRDWTTEWLSDWVTEWLSYWLSVWVTDWLKKGLSEGKCTIINILRALNSEHCRYWILHILSIN